MASDAVALIPWTRQVFFLDDNQMATIEDDSVLVKDVKTGKKINIKPQKLTWTLKESEKR